MQKYNSVYFYCNLALQDLESTEDTNSKKKKVLDYF